MRKITISHVSSISRAEYFVNQVNVPNMHPHHRKQIEDDLDNLAAVREFLLRLIYYPEEPVLFDTTEEQKPDGDTS